MFENYNEIMTIDEVCEVLMIGRNRCYHLLGDGAIKGFRIGSVWKIPRDALMEYIRDSSASRGNTVSSVKKARRDPVCKK